MVISLGRKWVINLHPLKRVRGGTRDLPMEGLRLSAGGLKWLENAVFICHVAKCLPKETQNSSAGGGG